MEKEAGNISQEESSSPLNLSKEPVIKGKFVQDFTTKTLPDEPTPIFVGDSLKIFVQKVGFMRQKKFILEDHQFLVKVESLNDKPPLLSSILSVLETSLEQMLDNLRTFYKAEDQNLVYITIHQSEMESAMNSSAFEISTTSNHIILSHVLGMFNRIFQFILGFYREPMLMILQTEEVPLSAKSFVKIKNTNLAVHRILVLANVRVVLKFLLVILKNQMPLKINVYCFTLF